MPADHHEAHHEAARRAAVLVGVRLEAERVARVAALEDLPRCTHVTDHPTRGLVACPTREGLGLYLCGLRCPRHTPARVAGRPDAAPDPSRTTTARIAAPLVRRPTLVTYGTATSDPLGRDAPGWKLADQSRLPVKVKIARDPDDEEHPW